MNRMPEFFPIVVLAVLANATSLCALAADPGFGTPAPTAPPAPAAPSGVLQPPPAVVPTAQATQRAERVNIESLKKKFGVSDTQVSVVQHRLYSKSGRLELGVFYGSISTSPFLDVSSVGGTLGFHLSEYFGINMVYWKDNYATSAGVATFETTSGLTVNEDNPQSFMGGELSFNPIYGKLSVIGKAIIYYDLHLIGGAGVRQTESGKYFSPIIGIGQQIYLSKLLSLRLDYRVLKFTEDIPDKQKGSGVAGQKDNTTSAVTLGVNMLIF